MGSSKKNKDKDRDREHKKKKRHRSRSRERHDKHDKHERKSRKEEKLEKRKRRENGESRHSEPSASYKPQDASDSYASKHDYPEAPSEVHPPPKEPRTSSIDQQPLHEGGEKLTLSIADANKVRAKLGLKPLDVPGGPKDESKPDKKEDVHVPAVNLAEVKKTSDIREKMLQMKEKRRINMMLGKVKTLADDSDDEGALSWVRKSRKVQEEKAKAARQARILEEMDAEFGIGDLVQEEFVVKKKYTSKDLTGLKVQHDQDRFGEGRTMVLTLQDRGILEDGDDTLVNVNIQDDERADKYKENKKKKPDYNPYADEFDEYGVVKPRELLDKYDEEIHGEKKEMFELGRGGRYDAEHEKMVKAMRRDIQARGESLVLPAPMLAKEFYTETEMASFNKVTKKKRKLRKKQKIVTADDLMPLGREDQEDFGSRKKKRLRKTKETEEGEISEEVIKSEAIPGLDLVDMDMDKMDPFGDMDIEGAPEDLEGVIVEDEGASLELEMVLLKTHKLKQKQDINVRERDKRLANTLVKQEEEMPSIESEHKSGQIVLNATSEFCRTLGEIPTYGLAGNRPEEDDELLDFEQELIAQRRVERDEKQLGWQEVEIDTRPVEIKEEAKAVLDDEPVVSDGLAGALELANKKGFLEKQQKKAVSAPTHKILEAQNYSIEDKRYDDLDEKTRKRGGDRFGGGMVSDFKDKTNYKPAVKLEYMDEGGRQMNPKEAFRYLSHRFHGKGSGMRKTEKRQKKQAEVQLLKNMSSTDTPLGTVALLTEKQKVEKTPYILLSGKPQTSLSK